jgi:hypothetical protein
MDRCTMNKLIRKFNDLRSDPSFLRFQHHLIADIYDQLGQGYSAGEGEVSLVTRIADSLKGKNYKGLTIHCEKIHGSKSYVSFTFRDKPTMKELGDLILITVISDGRKRLLQKLCIIQNKVLRDGKAHIDLEQLFLLKNFPLFSGTGGLFRGAKDVMFLNRQQCLGSYGFFDSPGELILVNAGILSNVINGSSTFNRAQLGSLPQGMNGAEEGDVFGLQGIPAFLDPMIMEEVFHYWYKRGFPIPFHGSFVPFSSSRRTLHDLHDVIRTWTSLRLGELVYALDQCVDEEANNFASTILRTIGFGQTVDLEGGNGEGELNSDATVMVAHLDISQE